MFINFLVNTCDPSPSKHTNIVLDEHFIDKSDKTSKFTLRNNFYVSKTETRPVQVVDSSCHQKAIRYFDVLSVFPQLQGFGDPLQTGTAIIPCC